MDDVNDKLFHRVVAFLSCFLFMYIGNWVILSTIYIVPIIPIVEPAPLPIRIMEPFLHSNNTLLSPKGQDMRWRDFSDYYSRYQSKLVKSGYEYYVVYTTTNSGLANKINGLVSSLLIAMVTDRGLMYDWPSFDSYYSLPLDHHHYNINTTMPKGSTLKIWHRCIEAKRLKSGNINDEFGEGNINVITNCPIYESLAKNDLYYDDFVKRGLVRTAHRGNYTAIASDLYFRLLNFFSLESSLQRKYENITESWKNRYVIGLQIRVGMGNSNFMDNCKFLFMDDIQKFVIYADYYSNRTNLKPLWFISTDSSDVEKRIQKSHPDWVFFIKDLPMKHSKSLAYEYGDPSVQRAILDNQLLSRSDLLLTTAWSSFGQMALGRMAHGATILITRSDRIVNPPPIIHFNRHL